MGGAPVVSIGMPVQNGGEHIRNALDSILGQDFGDFELIVSDNASTDDTWDILLGYARRERRIALHRQTEAIAVAQNFHFVLNAARCDYFLWAAHDDVRDANYLSALLDCIGGFGLCCPKVIKIRPDHGVISEHKFPEVPTANSMHRTRRMMAASQAAWVYGLFRTASLSVIYPWIAKTGIIWGSDHLVLLSFLLDQNLTGTNETAFFQMKTGISGLRFKPRSPASRARFAARLSLIAFQQLSRARLSRLHKIYLFPYLCLYLDCQVFHLGTRLRRRAQRLIRDFLIMSVVTSL